MDLLKLEILNGEGAVISASSGSSFAELVYAGTYQEGDKIRVSSCAVPSLLSLQLDDAIGKCAVYLTGEMIYPIPFGEKRANMSQKAFAGNVHYLFAEDVSALVTGVYRNLACNPYDIAGNTACYPHASANIETRNETIFAARNAIDGVRANLFHGEWPYTSWGINQRDDAEFRLDFGRKVLVDEIRLYTRSDFPHDNWWERITITFSNGERLCAALKKSVSAHIISFEKKEVEWLLLHDLIKADDPSPFPALTQIEVYGREASE